MTTHPVKIDKKRYSSWRGFLIPIVFLIKKKAWKILFRGILFPLILAIIIDFNSYTLFSHIAVFVGRGKYLFTLIRTTFLLFPVPSGSLFSQYQTNIISIYLYAGLVYSIILRICILINGYRFDFKEYPFGKTISHYKTGLITWRGYQGLPFIKIPRIKTISIICGVLMIIFIAVYKIKDNNIYNFYVSKCKMDVMNCYGIDDSNGLLNITLDYENGKISKQQYLMQKEEASKKHDEVTKCLMTVGATNSESCESHAKYQLDFYKMGSIKN